jgi:hypothetical protein
MRTENAKWLLLLLELELEDWGSSGHRQRHPKNGQRLPICGEGFFAV